MVKLIPACTAALLLLIGASAEARYQFNVTNKCHLPLRLAIYYDDAIEDKWKMEHWYRIAPNTTTSLANRNGRTLLTRNMNYYYFAELYKDSSHAWRGSHDHEVEGRVLAFRHIRDEVGNNDVALSCDNLEGVRMIRIHNDCDADVRLGMHHMQTNDEWRTAYYSWLPGQRSFVDIVTRNSYAAVFAESSDGSNLTWSGDEQDPLDKVYEFDNTYVRYRTIRFREDEGVYEYAMGCNKYSEQALRNAARDPVTSNRTEIRIIYRNFLYAYVPVWWAGFLPLDYRRYPHAILMAVHPTNPAKGFYADAGPARGTGGKGKKTRECSKPNQLCGRVRSASFMLNDPNYQNYQSFVVDMPFDMVVEKLIEFRDRVNELELQYSLLSLNCNSFVFSFLRNRLSKYVEPRPFDPGNDIYVLAWDVDVPDT